MPRGVLAEIAAFFTSFKKTRDSNFRVLEALWAWRSGIPWSGRFCLFALGWALGTLASNWTSRTGDYSKGRRPFLNQLCIGNSRLHLKANQA